MPIHVSRLNIDNLKSRIRSEMLRYESAIGKDSPFGEVKKIRKQINKLKHLLAEQEQTGCHS